MSTVVRAPLRAEFWVGALAVVAGLWIWRSYGSRFPRLPGSNGG